MSDHETGPDDLLDDPDLDDLTAAVLEGRPVDWAGARSSLAQEYAEELRLLAEVIDVHRSAPPLQGQWGPLMLLERLGAGASGEVYRAWDRALDREVALKILHASDGVAPGDAPGPSIEEGRLLARVRHPNIVTVYGAERVNGRIGIWTELLSGQTLAEIVGSDGPIDFSTAIGIGIDLCRALAAVHREGVLHRDVKAHNVMREADGRIVLVDFGAGRESMRPDVHLGGESAGTPLYLAPEVWEGEAATPQADVYSLGVLLFFLVSGAYPVQAQTPSEIRDAHRQDRRVRLTALRPDLPGTFVAAVERALSKRPGDRYAGAAQFETALQRLQHHEAPAGRSSQRWPIALAVVIVGAAVAVGLWRWLGVSSDAKTERWLINLGAERIVPSETLGNEIALAPGGQFVAYSAGGTDRAPARIFVRRLGSDFKPLALPGTDGGHHPFFSPNGRRVGFARNSRGGEQALNLTPVDGGPVATLIACTRGCTAAWSADGTIVYSNDGNLWRVRETGGTPERLTAYANDVEAVDPAILPGGAVLFTVRAGSKRSIAVLPLGAGSVRTLVEGHLAKFLPPGYLVYVNEGLRVVPFDPRRLTIGRGQASFDVHPAFGWFDVSAAGQLIYGRIRDAERPDDTPRLVWVDPKTGQPTVVPSSGTLETTDLISARVSPDGGAIAMLGDGAPGHRTVVVRATATLEVQQELGTAGRLVGWTPDGLKVSLIANSGEIINRPVDGRADEAVTAPEVKLPAGCSEGFWSPDERSLLLRCGGPAQPTLADLWLLTRPIGSAMGPPLLRPWAVTRARENDAGFSPDGRWVVFRSSDRLLLRAASGTLPETVIAQPGAAPSWTARGIYYLSNGVPFLRPIVTTPSLHLGAPQRLAPGFEYRQQNGWMEVAGDGRLLFFQGIATGGFASELHLVQNWLEEVRQQMSR